MARREGQEDDVEDRFDHVHDRCVLTRSSVMKVLISKQVCFHVCTGAGDEPDAVWEEEEEKDPHCAVAKPSCLSYAARL